MSETDALTVTLTLDNDEELECSVLTIFEGGESQYIALLRVDESGDSSDSPVYLYRFLDNGGDAEPEIENILDDDEFERASEAFNNWMDEQAFGDIDLDDPY